MFYSQPGIPNPLHNPYRRDTDDTNNPKWVYGNESLWQAARRVYLAYRYERASFDNVWGVLLGYYWSASYTSENQEVIDDLFQTLEQQYEDERQHQEAAWARQADEARRRGWTLD